MYYSRIKLGIIFDLAFLQFRRSKYNRITKKYNISKKLIMLQPRNNPNKPPILPKKKKNDLKTVKIIENFQKLIYLIVR